MANNINSGVNTPKGPQGSTGKSGNSSYPASTQNTVQSTKKAVEKTLDK